VDELDTLLREDGFMRNHFAFLVDEVKGLALQILEEMPLKR